MKAQSNYIWTCILTILILRKEETMTKLKKGDKLIQIKNKLKNPKA